MIESLFKAELERVRNKYEEIKEKARDTKKIGKEMKTLAKKSVTPFGFLSLLSNSNILYDWTYALAFIMAFLKDISDWFIIGSFPLIGTTITILTSIFIGFMMLLANFLEGDRSVFQKTLMRYIALGIGTIIEFIFALNFFPWQLFTVAFIFFMALAARENQKRVIEQEA